MVKPKQDDRINIPNILSRLFNYSTIAVISHEKSVVSPYYYGEEFQLKVYEEYQRLSAQLGENTPLNTQ